jgi:hypothetical protein
LVDLDIGVVLLSKLGAHSKGLFLLRTNFFSSKTKPLRTAKIDLDPLHSTEIADNGMKKPRGRLESVSESMHSPAAPDLPSIFYGHMLLSQFNVQLRGEC